MDVSERSAPSGVTITVLMENTASDDRLACEHGLSLWIETPGGNILFDTGASDGFAANARVLGIDLASADLIVLSHGHSDHVGGLSTALKMCSAPVITGPGATTPKYAAETEGPREIGMDRETVLAIADRLRIVDSREEILPGVEILPAAELVSPVPTDNARLLRRNNGATEPDSFDEELSLLIRTQKRPVLVTGCSHRGIANIHRSAGTQIGAIVGGLHLLHESEEMIREAAREIAEADDFWIGHCTGNAGVLFIEEALPGRLHGIAAGARARF